METNPRLVFERLFGDIGTTDPAVRLQRIRKVDTGGIITTVDAAVFRPENVAVDVEVAGHIHCHAARNSQRSAGGRAVIAGEF